MFPWCVDAILEKNTPDSKVYGANMGPTWVLSAPDGPHVGPMSLDIWHHSLLQDRGDLQISTVTHVISIAINHWIPMPSGSVFIVNGVTAILAESWTHGGFFKRLLIWTYADMCTLKINVIHFLIDRISMHHGKACHVTQTAAKKAIGQRLLYYSL